MLLPFAEDILSVSGSIQLFALTIFLPIQMHIKHKAIQPGSKKWNALQLLNLCCFCITIAAVISSVVSLKQDVEGFRPFDNTA